MKAALGDRRIVIAQPVKTAALGGEALYEIEVGLHATPTRPGHNGAAQLYSVQGRKTPATERSFAEAVMSATAGPALSKSEIEANAKT